MKKEFNIAIDGSIFIEDEYEDERIYLSNLFSSLSNPWEITIYLPNGQNKLENNYLSSHIKTKIFSTNIHSKFLWQHIFLPKAAIKNKHDFIICPGLHVPFWKKVKTISIFNNITDVTVKHFKRTWASYNRYIIASLKSIKDELKERYALSSSKIFVVYPSLEKEFLDAFSTTGLDQDKGEYILYVGKNDPTQRPVLAIKLLKLILQSGYKLKMLMLGIPLREKRLLEAKAQEFGVEKHIIFLSQVGTKVLATLYQKARFLLFPSLRKSFHFSLLKAMASMTPILASDVPVNREITAGHALLLPEIIGVWQKRIEALLSGEMDLAPLLSKARERALIFSPENTSRRFLEALEELAQGG